MVFKRKFKKKDSETNKSGKINHRKTVVDDITFDSKMESDYYLLLKEQKEKGEIKDFELQVKFELQEKFIRYNGETIFGSHKDFSKIQRNNKGQTIAAITYIADFVITNNDDSKHVVDTKGISTKDFEIKKKMFMCKYPSLPIYVLVYNKKTKTWDDYYECKKEKARVKREKAKKEK